MSDFVVSQIRTYVPMAVGWALTYLAGGLAVLKDFGISVDGAAAKTAVTGLVVAVYYAVARLLEQKFPRFGWLLGVPKPPTYTS